MRKLMSRRKKTELPSQTLVSELSTFLNWAAVKFRSNMGKIYVHCFFSTEKLEVHEADFNRRNQWRVQLPSPGGKTDV
jgi:hypothetical protein